MGELYTVEVEPEVRSWLAGLTDRDFGRVDFLVGLLAEQAETLSEPCQHTPRSIGRCRDVNAEHSSYDDLAQERRGSAEYHEGYAEARRAFLIGRAVRDRRLALGLSQTELAARAGMTQPALSRLEAGGVIPTIPLLERISAALDADLIVQISPHAA
jgi:ribosome-binding protein aMBF1 (putative translation factor)